MIKKLTSYLKRAVQLGAEDIVIAKEVVFSIEIFIGFCTCSIAAIIHYILETQVLGPLQST